jgi:hypothetical protein
LSSKAAVGNSSGLGAVFTRDQRWRVVAPFALNPRTAVGFAGKRKPISVD